MAQPRFRDVEDEVSQSLLPSQLLEDSEEGSISQEESLRAERSVPPLRLRVVRPEGPRTPSSSPPVRYLNSEVRATASRPVAPGHQVPPVPGRGRGPLLYHRGRTPEPRPRGWEARDRGSLPEMAAGRILPPPPPMMGRRPPGLGVRYQPGSPAPMGMPSPPIHRGILMAPRTPSPPLMVVAAPPTYTYMGAGQFELHQPCHQCHRACNCPRWHWVQQ